MTNSIFEIEQIIACCAPTSNIEVNRMQNNAGFIAKVDNNTIELFDYEFCVLDYEADRKQFIETKLKAAISYIGDWDLTQSDFEK